MLLKLKKKEETFTLVLIFKISFHLDYEKIKIISSTFMPMLTIFEVSPTWHTQGLSVNILSRIKASNFI